MLTPQMVDLNVYYKVVTSIDQLSKNLTADYTARATGKGSPYSTAAMANSIAKAQEDLDKLKDQFDSAALQEHKRPSSPAKEEGPTRRSARVAPKAVQAPSAKKSAAKKPTASEELEEVLDEVTKDRRLQKKDYVNLLRDVFAVDESDSAIMKRKNDALRDEIRELATVKDLPALREYLLSH